MLLPMPVVEAPFDLPSDLVGVAVRTLLVYMFLVVALRVGGKKQLGQLTLFEFVVVLVISDAVQNSMVGENTSLLGGFVAVAVLLSADKVLDAVVAGFPGARRIVEGEPTLLVSDGRPLSQAMRREGVELPELARALREHGLERPEDARLVVLEADGTISVVPRLGPEWRSDHRMGRRARRLLERAR